MREQRFKPYSVSTTDGEGFVIGIQKEDGTVMSITDASEMLNEQQATINKVYELLEEADIFSDEATEHDIKAYIELQEFDNKDAYYLACGIKKAIKLLKGD